MLKNFIESLIGLIKFIKLNNEEKEFVFFSESRFYRNYYIEPATKKRHYPGND